MPEKKCKICNANFYVKPSHLKLGYGKYCSRKCQFLGQKKGKLVYCHICRKETWKTPRALKCSKSKKYFCSKSCQTIWRNKKFSGKFHSNWQGGENVYRRLMIKSKIPKKCQLCGIKDKRVLVVHHQDLNRKNNNLNNLIWLCRNCHYLKHL